MSPGAAAVFFSNQAIHTWYNEAQKWEERLSAFVDSHFEVVRNTNYQQKKNVPFLKLNAIY